MTTKHWTNAAGGAFNTAANWSPTGVPGVTDDVLIDAAGTYTVTSSANNSVNTLGLAMPDKLDIAAGTAFAINNGTGSGTIAGAVFVENGAVLALNGPIVNSGTIGAFSNGAVTSIQLTGAVTTFSGGGTVTLSNNANNRIIGAAAANTLVNVNNIISGAGLLGAGQMTLTNQKAGVVNAVGNAGLVVNTGANVITNAGTLEATGGNLFLQSTVNNAGGTIQAVGGAGAVYLQAVVKGGTLTDSSGGDIVASGTGAVLDGTAKHFVSTAGSIDVLNNSALGLKGQIINTGKINLLASANFSDLKIASPVVTLSGTGTIALSDSANNRIYGTIGSFQLVNNGNTITGAGQLGMGSMVLVNKGVVNASGTANALVLNSGGNIAINAGTLEDTGKGGLVIQGTVDNGGGTILATGAGSHVDLGSSSAIEGGTLATSKGGVIQVLANQYAVLDGLTDGAITNTGTLMVQSGASVGLTGVINNTGTIQELGSPGVTAIDVNGATVTLKGGGRIWMMDSANNRIVSGGAPTFKLINMDNIISGAGTIGAGSMQLDNRGLINAMAKVNALVIDTGAYPVTNTGTIESTGTAAGNGGLVIGQIAINNAGGTIQAIGTNSHVDLAGIIQGGMVRGINGGVIQVKPGAPGRLDGLTVGAISLAGTISIQDNASLVLSGTVHNAGTIQINGFFNGTGIRLGSPVVTLTGGGTVQMSAFSSNIITGIGSNDELINADNTIVGSGLLGIAPPNGNPQVNALILINHGLINGNGQLNSLSIRTGANSVVNDGTIESTGPQGVDLEAIVQNAGGTIQAVGAGAVLYFGDATVAGGTLATSKGGIIQVIAQSSAWLDGISDGALTNAGTLLVTNGETLSTMGAINNTGLIEMMSTGGATDLRVIRSTAVIGTGTLLLSDNANNRIYTPLLNGDTVTFTNAGTIAGAGQFGVAGTLGFSNQGVVNATGNNAFVFQIAGSGSNSGLMEDTGSGGLQFSGSTLNNAGGTIAAFGGGSHVDLNAAVIQGGTLATSGGGVIQAKSGNIGFLDGLTAGALTNTGKVLVNDSGGLFVGGTIVNSGTISLAASANAAILGLASQTVTLKGGGTMAMSDSSGNSIAGLMPTYQLINQDNTISGAGSIGSGNMRLSNSGSIIATGTHALNVALGTMDGVNTVSGVMEGQGAAGLVLQSGYFDNEGTFAALNGSSLTMQSAAFLSNLSDGVLINGLWEAISTGAGATLSITGGPVVEDDANIVLSGANSVIQAGDGVNFTKLESSLATIDAGAMLTITGGRNYTSTLSVVDSGSLQLGGGTLSLGALTITAGANLYGTGTVAKPVRNLGVIDANGGLLRLNGAVSGSGSLQIDNASTLQVGTAAQNVQFSSGAVSKLKLTTPASFTGGIKGLALGDVIDLAGTTATNATVSAGTLSVTTTGGTLQYKVAGALAGNHFAIASDGAGGSNLTLTAGAAMVAHAQPAAMLAAPAGTLGFADLFGGSGLVPGSGAGGWAGTPASGLTGGSLADLFLAAGVPDALAA